MRAPGTQRLFLHDLLIIVLFSIRTTVSLLVPHPVCVVTEKQTKKEFRNETQTGQYPGGQQTVQPCGLRFRPDRNHFHLFWPKSFVTHQPSMGQHGTSQKRGPRGSGKPVKPALFSNLNVHKKHEGPGYRADSDSAHQVGAPDAMCQIRSLVRPTLLGHGHAYAERGQRMLQDATRRTSPFCLIPKFKTMIITWGKRTNVTVLREKNQDINLIHGRLQLGRKTVEKEIKVKMWFLRLWVFFLVSTSYY